MIDARNIDVYLGLDVAKGEHQTTAVTLLRGCVNLTVDLG
ncbi:hypothetical protein QFZ63_000181 [Streptomyces sp. B3I7]|nr:hypothetical protein [Streptomyces sp. B3I7]